MKITKRVQSIQPSATMSISAKAKALQAQGISVIDLGLGEPDFDTPRHIKDSGIKAIEDGWTKYTPSGGLPELKRAISNKLHRENSLEFSQNQILVSCGAKHSLFNICQSLFEEGDEVIIPSPYWVSYVDQVIFHQATPVILPTRVEDGFLIRPRELERLIHHNTRALILNSPSNPTGAAYDQGSLEKIAEIAVRHGLLVISDEIYENITYEGFQHVSIASLNPEIKDLTLLVNGVSKSFSMTGWRIGYTAGPEEIIRAMDKVQSQSTSNPCSISQMAAISALEGSLTETKDMVGEFDRRRRFGVDRLNQIPGVNCWSPLGAFYLFPDFSKYFGRTFKGSKIQNSSELSKYLLEEARVALVPGEAFGSDRHVRISYATSMENLEEAFDRIEEALKNLA